MKKILLLLVCLVSGFYLSAQENQNVDEDVFPDVVFSQPNPPKPIKGWELVQSVIDGEMILVGEYPGKIIKFQFIGDTVGIETEVSQEAGIIEYSVDGADWKILDLFEPLKNENSSGNFYTLEGDLKSRHHTLQIRLTDQKNSESYGNKCLIRNFYYNSPD